MGLQLEPSWEVIQFNMNSKIFALACMAALAGAAPAADADAEADAQFLGYAGHAVAHSVTETVKHACREVTTEHCVDNPKIIEVPVEVEHCHTVTKVTCADVENKLPKTTCEAVVTTATSHAAVAAPLPVAHHVAPVGYAYGH